MQAAALSRSITFEGGLPMAAVTNGSEAVGEFDESSHGEAEGKQTSADPSVVLGRYTLEEQGQSQSWKEL